jgi:hypothetical protein
MVTARRGVITLDDLRDHLQYAIGLGLTTIPAYLCALYSIVPGANTAACEVIESVVLEEMLHMALAANILNAVGGAPASGPAGGGPSPVPVYPATAPFIDALPVIHLRAFSPTVIDEFIAIERAASQKGASQKGASQKGATAAGVGQDAAAGAGQDAAAAGVRYGSIGAFYAAIEAGLRALGTPEVFRRGREARAGCQLTAENYYGGGTVIEVTDLDSARAAIGEIVGEGEGVPPPSGWTTQSRYARFSEIRAGRYYQPGQLAGDVPAGDILPVDWRAVHPMAPDPAAQAYHGTWAYQPMMAFNAAYTALVDTIYRGFNGEPMLLREAVPGMYELKYQATSLLTLPSPAEPGRTLGPAFEYLTLPRRTAAALVYPQRRPVTDQAMGITSARPAP